MINAIDMAKTYFHALGRRALTELQSKNAHAWTEKSREYWASVLDHFKKMMELN